MSDDRKALVKREMQQVSMSLSQLKDKISPVLPPGVSFERFTRVAIHQIASNPYLLELDRTSLYAAIMTCAQLRLEPDVVLGHAYLVPFGKKVALVAGYKGYIHLAQQDPDFKFIDSQIVYENDFFEETYGFEPNIVHRPARRGSDRGQKIAVYAVAGYKNGARYGAVMTMEEVDAIRERAAKSRGGKDGPAWSDAATRGEMEKKTAIRRLAKYLPLHVRRAAAIEDELDEGRVAQINDSGDLILDVSEAQPAPSEPTVAPGSTAALDALAAKGAAPAPQPDLIPAPNGSRGRGAKRQTMPTEPAHAPQERDAGQDDEEHDDIPR